MPRNLEKPIGKPLARLMLAYGATTLGELAVACGAPENTVRNWHKRDTVPLTRIRQAAEQTGRPFEWFVQNDLGPVFLPDEANKLAKSATGDAFGQEEYVTKNNGNPHPSPSRSVPKVLGLSPNVKQSVAIGDAHELPGGAPGKSVNSVLLSAVLGAVMAELARQGLQLPPAKLAELTALLYEDAAGSNATDKAGQMQHAARRYLRLVA